MLISDLDDNQPLVSIMISTYNRAEYLRLAAQSCLLQTFTDFELIICDDASVDETPQICRELAVLDARVRILRHPTNLGMVDNWNSGLAASQGRYFAKLDDDNLYLPQFLDKTVAALLSNSDVCFAFSDEWLINQIGERDNTQTEKLSERYGRATLRSGVQKETALLAVKQSFGINATLFVREALVNIGGFRKFAGISADMDLFLRLAEQGWSAYYVPERIIEYRAHTGMGTVSAPHSIDRTQANVEIWRDRTFKGKAERLRRIRLSAAYISLCRTLLLNYDFRAARSACVSAWKFAPFRPLNCLLLAFVYLPARVVLPIMKLRYRKN